MPVASSSFQLLKGEPIVKMFFACENAITLPRSRDSLLPPA
jgi:hypothetical protein